jgi:hypothetical protein
LPNHHAAHPVATGNRQQTTNCPLNAPRSRHPAYRTDNQQTKQNGWTRKLDNHQPTDSHVQGKPAALILTFPKTIKRYEPIRLMMIVSVQRESPVERGRLSTIFPFQMRTRNVLTRRSLGKVDNQPTDTRGRTATVICGEATLKAEEEKKVIKGL